MLRLLHKKWWKILSVILLFYTFIGGLIINVPARYVLYETIRNVFFHVPVWFAMIFLLFINLYYSIKYLRRSEIKYDIIAAECAKVGVVFGVLGFLSGMLWGNYTWGDLMSWLFNDTKILGAFIGLMIYAAYFVLRGSVDDEEKRAKVAGVYSIFAFALLNVFVFVLPRLKDSLHPGNGGNPAFATYDLDNAMRIIFYPSVIGYFLLGLWIATLLIRIRFLHYRLNNIPL